MHEFGQWIHAVSRGKDLTSKCKDGHKPAWLRGFSDPCQHCANMRPENGGNVDRMWHVEVFQLPHIPPTVAPLHWDIFRDDAEAERVRVEERGVFIILLIAPNAEDALARGKAKAEAYGFPTPAPGTALSKSVGEAR